VAVGRDRQGRSYRDIPKVAISEQEPDLIVRISAGILAHKKATGWWECGDLLTDEQMGEKALEYAKLIVNESERVSDKEPSGWRLNPWGLAGTIANESRFDRCALGLNPRKSAYKMFVIKQRRRSISHSEKEVLDALKNPLLLRQFQNRGYDLGLAQILTRGIKGVPIYSRMLNAEYNIIDAANKMRIRGIMYKTDRPWMYWPGFSSKEYDGKVIRWARKLGALDGDI
jgi:hypothetical protein